MFTHFISLFVFEDNILLCVQYSFLFKILSKKSESKVALLNINKLFSIQTKPILIQSRAIFHATAQVLIMQVVGKSTLSYAYLRCSCDNVSQRTKIQVFVLSRRKPSQDDVRQRKRTAECVDARLCIEFLCFLFVLTYKFSAWHSSCLVPLPTIKCFVLVAMKIPTGRNTCDPFGLTHETVMEKRLWVWKKFLVEMLITVNEYAIASFQCLFFYLVTFFVFF